MISSRQQRGGFTIIGLLICLAIIGILTQEYFSTDTPEGKMWVQTQYDKAHKAAMLSNLRSAQTQYAMWRMDGRLTTQEIAQKMDGLSTQYGGGGRFFVGPNDQVLVTTDLKTPTFAERMKLPAAR
jgi:Tfp pilus assembly protein PilE